MTTAKLPQEKKVEERLMGYGGDIDNPRYFIYTPPGMNVESFMWDCRPKLLDRFIDSIQKAFNGINLEDPDRIFHHAYRARRIGRVLGIRKIDECTRYIMQEFLAQLQSSITDLEKIRNYAKEFGIEFKG
jgi:hypothetical protein